MKPMQSMFQRKRHQVPSLNVASMPDLIFTVLFFFMIVTHMRSDEVKVKLEVPQGTGVQKLANKASVVNIYIGQLNGEWGVQLNGDLISINDISARIEEIRGGMSAENADKLTISLRADRHTPMGIITDVKQALQQSYALRINYSATEFKQND
jgi:biopolymer transport protein ExbD